MKRITLITILFTLVLFADGYAQNGSIIEGTVKDHKTGEPLANVNVYINGSTIGTSTNNEGFFKLEGIAPGVYPLVFTRIGYIAVERRVVLGKNQIAKAETDLEPHVYNMKEVQVTGTYPKKWKRRLQVFKDEFLGSSEFADQCVIVNPEVLDFTIDHKTGDLVARTDSALIIINNALGYRMRIKLISFRWHGETGTYKIYPFFKEMKPSSPMQLNEWKTNRETAYKYSIRHFLFALYHNAALKDGYRYKWGIYRLSNKKNQEELAKRGLSNVPLTGFRIDNDVSVRYEATESEIIKLKPKYFFVDSNGNLLNPISVSLAGNWDNYRVGALIPFNYKPKD
ncbi:MAG TPA: carboxypeptidase-like regulatory domain-containing protein [Balneolales bacterium]|nr:carboxypeptidase-like regulatory domain-containing protein [Balneolales bacterium]